MKFRIDKSVINLNNRTGIGRQEISLILDQADVSDRSIAGINEIAYDWLDLSRKLKEIAVRDFLRAVEIDVVCTEKVARRNLGHTLADLMWHLVIDVTDL